MPQSETEGYVYHSYGKEKYLRHAVASAITLRRFDKKRSIGILCSPSQIERLQETGFDRLFNIIKELPEKHCSIVGFKHHLHRFLLFDKNIFLDSDIVWCKNPDRLWKDFETYPFTSTGALVADSFFGGPKNIGIVKDFIFGRRAQTLKKFGITQLSRIQSGLVYASDKATTEEVCTKAQYFLSQIDNTHFQSRLKEKGRSEESCEWSLAMAMAFLKMPVYPWLNGYQSAQLDFIDNYTIYNENFTHVECKFYPDEFVYNLRGLKSDWWQKQLTRLFSLIPGKGDYMMVTPYCLHFGWLHQKVPFLDFADDIWEEALENGIETVIPTTPSNS